ncbi:hypothetical protein BDP27DRAFT_1364857 [Rhodocollybia butyracea]|uniref:Uncharacterized protein n=1 Tax=Rhodocollybia butyracea TaxID=206335 RepID=A0A9P5P7Y5_9AGAR|nr:hypothetical protein BDP27DRAFT_1523111 [Rhodocollybia butyracea]KAF9067532.1 hypothetical protein BDP27DRAFT_1364857 [Rhodocollybia butyracea]
MFLARFSALFFLFASFGIVASIPSATPVEIAKRQSESALDIFTTLKNSTDIILPQITTLVQAGNATEDNVTPLINSLRTALQNTSSSISSVAPASDNAAANLAVEIFTDIADTLLTLPGEIAPTLAAILGDVDSGLGQVITVVQVLNPIITVVLQGVTGALNFVAALIP